LTGEAGVDLGAEDVEGGAVDRLGGGGRDVADVLSRDAARRNEVVRDGDRVGRIRIAEDDDVRVVDELAVTLFGGGKERDLVGAENSRGRCRRVCGRRSTEGGKERGQQEAADDSDPRTPQAQNELSSRALSRDGDLKASLA